MFCEQYSLITRTKKRSVERDKITRAKHARTVRLFTRRAQSGSNLPLSPIANFRYGDTRLNIRRSLRALQFQTAKCSFGSERS